jgi:hypothetical protein
MVETCRREYNEKRPHRSLGYRTPKEYAAVETNRVDGGCAPQTPRRSPRQAFGGKHGATAPKRWNTHKQTTNRN